MMEMEIPNLGKVRFDQDSDPKRLWIGEVGYPINFEATFGVLYLIDRIAELEEERKYIGRLWAMHKRSPNDPGAVGILTAALDKLAEAQSDGNG